MFKYYGTRLKFHRKYINNTTYNKALYKLPSYKNKTIEQLLSSVNCYIGILKSNDNYFKLQEYKYLVLDRYKEIIDWNENKLCFNANVKYKYRLKYKVNQIINII